MEYFAGYGLGLEKREPPELGLDAAQLGSMLHAILEESYKAAEDPGDVEAVLEAMQLIAMQAFGEAPEVYGFRPTPLYDLECEAWLEALKESVRGLAEEGSGWVPVAYEQIFGIGDTPPLRLDLHGEHVLVRGFIDRVDRNAAGELRIVDYKTGQSRLSITDLHEGRRLQLPVYALGARDAVGLGEPVEGFYWAILAAKRGSLRLSRFKIEVEGGEITGPEAAYAVAREHIAGAVHGVRAGRFPPRPPRGGCPSYCPAVGWCWKYEAGYWW
jgi:RecB family exonuclease